MAPLSNAERQARWREKLKAQATGVTPEMIVQAGRIMYREIHKMNGEPENWAGYLASCHKKRGGNDWDEMLPDDVRPDAYDWVEDAADRALLEKVATVVYAVKYPPAE